MSDRIAVLIAAEVSPTLLDLMKRDVRFEVRYLPCRDEAALIAAIGDAAILITRHYNKVTRAVIEAAASLRLIAQGTSGLDNIALYAAALRRIDVISTPGANANAVAELVLSNMIALTRTIPFYHRSMMQGVWQRDDCATRRELRSHLIGIVGLGRVGTRVAQLAAAFGAKSIACDPYLTDDDFLARGAVRVATLDELLLRCDILTLHVPLTEQTRGMIGSAQLELLRDGSFVVNTSRGEVLDSRAMLVALGAGRIAGAALDVYDPEPPPRFEEIDESRLILTPHIAGCSKESKESIGRDLYDRICARFRFTPL